MQHKCSPSLAFFPSFLLYARTIRYLTPKQIFFRIFRFLPKFWIKPSRKSLILREPKGKFLKPLSKSNTLLGPAEFKFLNVSATIPQSSDWSSIGDGELWRYNLHYFDFINSNLDKKKRNYAAIFIDRWIDEQPFGTTTSWDAYPTSLRIVNLIKYHHRCSKLNAKIIQSLFQQSHWLNYNIEWHLMGNHLIANAKALIFAGCFFNSSLGDKWLKKGIKILSEQLSEQILEDGGHFELSVMYHAIILEDILDLICLQKCYLNNELAELDANLEKHARLMLSWLSVMSHPDGEISYFNDSCQKGASNLATLASYARRLGIPRPHKIKASLQELPASGYCRITKGPFSLIVDLAEVGASYIPGHAHADTLSFELSILGFRSIVNHGISTYNDGMQRQFERSTASHNTVCVAGENSSEVWAKFRTARRARVLKVAKSVSERAIDLSAEHNGYNRLANRPQHYRKWRCTDNKVIIIDQVSPHVDGSVGRLLLHPSMEITQSSKGEVVFLLPNNVAVRIRAQSLSIRRSFYSIGFNQREETNEIITPVIDGEAIACIEICDRSD